MMFYNKKKYDWQRKCFVFAILCCIVSIFYYSWLPDARFGKETYLPSWLRNWSNTYFNLRTGVPFVGLGFLLEGWSSIPTRFFIVPSSSPFRISTICTAALIVCVAEGGQFFVLNRHPDSLDVAFGILGSIFGGIIHYCIKNFIKIFLSKNA